MSMIVVCTRATQVQGTLTHPHQQPRPPKQQVHMQKTLIQCICKRKECQIAPNPNYAHTTSAHAYKPKCATVQMRTTPRTIFALAETTVNFLK